MGPAAASSHAGGSRERRRVQLIALTDVYLWKLLRSDLGISRAASEEIVREMVDAVCAPGGE